MDNESEPCSSKNDEPKEDSEPRSCKTDGAKEGKKKSARQLAKGNERRKYKKKLGLGNKSRMFGNEESEELLHESTREKKLFTCKECGRQMSKSADFEQHEKTHLGVKDFTCYECGKTFLGNYKMIRHQKTHLRQQSYSVKSISIQEKVTLKKL
ncbi:uncharacterized protein ACNLHF_014899 [Anomaloglossus baeobatrachus]